MKFDMSEAWRDATAMISANREVLLIVAGIFFFLPSLVVGFALGDMPEAMMADPEQAEQAFAALYANWWWLFVLALLATMVGYLSLLALLRDTARPTVGEALKAGLTGLLPAFGTYIVLSLAMGVVLTVLLTLAALSGNNVVSTLIGAIAVVLGVYVMVKVSLAGPVIAIDKVYNPFTVLRRSWSLTKGNSVRLALFYLLLGVAYVVGATVLGLVVALLSMVTGPALGVTVNAVVSGLLSAVITVVFVAVLAAVHRQLGGPSKGAVSETFE